MNLISIPGAPAWFDAALNLSAQASILAALVWIVLKLVGRWIPPGWRAWMWFLVIARVLVPFAPSSQFSLQNLFVRTPAAAVATPQVQIAPPPILNLRTVLPVQDGPMESPVLETSEPFETLPATPAVPVNWGIVFASVWISAAALLLAILAARSLVIRYRLARHGFAPATFILELLAACRAQLRLRYPVRATASDRIAAPALTGLIPARLIVPTTFGTERFSVAQIRQILLHELAHIQQGHLLLHWLTLIARAVHWFNPAIHFAANRLRQECELAADAAALKNSTEQERAHYGETILQVLTYSTAPRTLLALGMAEQARHLKQRLRALRTPTQQAAGVGFICTLLLAATGLTGATNEKREPNATAKTNLSPSEIINQFATRDFIRVLSNGEVQTLSDREIDEQLFRNKNLSSFNRNGVAGASKNDSQSGAQSAITNVTRLTTVQLARRMLLSADIQGAKSELQKGVENGTLDSIAVETTSILRPFTLLSADPSAPLTPPLAPPSTNNIVDLSDFPFVRRMLRNNRQTNVIEVPAPSARLDTLRDEQTRNSSAVEDARMLLELGRYGEAKTLLRQELQENPDNPAAQKLLNEINGRSAPELKRSTVAGANESEEIQDARLRANANRSLTNTAPISTHKKRLLERIDKLRIAEIGFKTETDLVEVLKQLGTGIRAVDMSHRGLNLILSQPSDRRSNSLPSIDTEKFQIMLDPPLRDVTVREVFDAIVKAAKSPQGAEAGVRLKYSVEDYGVVFSQDVGRERPHSAIQDKKAVSIQTSTLIQDARFLIEMGRLDAAEEKLDEAIKIGADHRVASYYLDLIEQRRSALESRKRDGASNDELDEIQKLWSGRLTRELLPTPNPFAVASTVSISPGRQSIYRKLETIHIDDFLLPNETELAEVLKELGSNIRMREVAGRGMNFIATVSDGIDAGSFKIKFNPPIHDVTLKQFLDALVMVAQPPQPPAAGYGVAYSVEDYAVVFRPRRIDQEPMVSRTFKVNPNTFRQGLEEVFPSFNPFQAESPSRQQTNGASGFFTFRGSRVSSADDSVVSKGSLQQQVRDFFLAAGVEFPTNNVAVGGAIPAQFGVAYPGGAQQKALFLEERTGVLYVRAPLRELDLIENAIHSLNAVPSQLRVDVHVYETSAAGLPAEVRTVLAEPQLPLLRTLTVATNVGWLTANQLSTFLKAAANSTTMQPVKSLSLMTLPGRQVRIPLEKEDSATVDDRTSALDMTITGDGDVPHALDLFPVVTTSEKITTETNTTPTYRVRQVALPKTKLELSRTLVIAAPANDSKRVPVLSDIPGVDRLFTKPESDPQQRIRLILITPVAVELGK
jgi:beta-lactamase regulating signal transducer with metallopeptidase domain